MTKQFASGTGLDAKRDLDMAKKVADGPIFLQHFICFVTKWRSTE